jgi:la-related protein 1
LDVPSELPQKSLCEDPSLSLLLLVGCIYHPDADLCSLYSSGEKTKWKPIPPEELQAAADAANRSYSHSNSSRTTSRQHSPHVNGRGIRRLPSEDFHPERSPAAKRQTNRPAPEKAESVVLGGSGSRNEHKAGLGQGSAVPPRVSPLRGASKLPRIPSSQSSPVEMRHPSQSGNIGQSNHQHRAGSAWPPRGRHNRGHYASYSQHGNHQPHRHRYHNGVNEAAMSQAAISGVSSYMAPSNPSAIPPTQHPSMDGQPQSHLSYPQLFYFPHYPTYLPTPAQAPYPTQDATNTGSIEDKKAPTRLREKRKRRPHPSEAAAVAGYQSYYPETLIVDLEQLGGSPKFWVVEDEEALMALDEEKPATYRPRRRRAPWSIGVDDSLRAQRWLWSLDIVEENPEEGESAETERTWTFGSLGEPATPPSLVALAADKVRDAILSAVSPINENKMQGSGGQGPPTAGWPVPGAGPSALDIGMAMGMGVVPHASSHPIGMPTPPLSMPPPSHSHPVSHQSPGTAVQPNMDWAIRDDPFVVVQPPYQHYRPHSGPVYQSTPPQRDATQETNTGGYGGGRGGRYDGEGSEWKSDREYGNGEYRAFGRGRGRGFSRVRGFRGGFRGGFGGGYNRQHGGPGATQGPPPPLPPNGPVIYIPEPIMPPPFAPYTPYMPNGYGGVYGPETPIAPGANNANVTSGPTRKPSPKPLSSIQFPLDAVRYKLLGQVCWNL